MADFQENFRWGWNSYFDAIWHDGAVDGAVPARVIAQQRGFWRVAGGFAECWAEASGKLRLAADADAEWPAVGDWVAVEIRDGEKSALILEVLPRRSRFVRKSPGKKVEEQVTPQMWTQLCWCPRWMAISIHGAWSDTLRSVGSPGRNRRWC